MQIIHSIEALRQWRKSAEYERIYYAIMPYVHRGQLDGLRFTKPNQ